VVSRRLFAQLAGRQRKILLLIREGATEIAFVEWNPSGRTQRNRRGLRVVKLNHSISHLGNRQNALLRYIIVAYLFCAAAAR